MIDNFAVFSTSLYCTL